MYAASKSEMKKVTRVFENALIMLIHQQVKIFSIFSLLNANCSSMIEKSQRRIVAEETSVAFIEKSKAEVSCEIPQVLEGERRKVFGNLGGVYRISIRIRAENI